MIDLSPNSQWVGNTIVESTKKRFVEESFETIISIQDQELVIQVPEVFEGASCSISNALALIRANNLDTEFTKLEQENDQLKKAIGPIYHALSIALATLNRFTNDPNLQPRPQFSDSQVTKVAIPTKDINTKNNVKSTPNNVVTIEPVQPPDSNK